MKFHKIIIVIFLLFSLFATKKISPVYSANEFSTSYDAEYTLSQNGQTKVSQNIKTTNQIAESYVSSFTLDLGTQKIKDIKASDKTGELKTKYTKNSTQSALLVEFKDKVIGKGSIRSFQIEYTSENIAQKQGSIFSVSIPKITGSNISDYNITIIAPNNIGKPSSIYPNPDKTESKSDAIYYSFTKVQLIKSGISFNFGTKQVYNIGLSYHLKNPQSSKVFTEIALPMNTSTQTIIFDTINPSPESISVDSDGNYIAKYILNPSQELDVEFTGKAIIYLNKIRQDQPLTAEQKQLFTKPQKYWESTDPKIASLAASLKTPEKIYQYVVDSLHYNSSRLQADQYTRKGAIGALNDTTDSVCMEFTDLFIALARAANIPAREVNGYGYTNDKSSRPLSLSQDLLHAWPEYWDDQKGWVQIDPTWSNTTHGTDYFNVFDLNHIAFVRKGLSSESPYPAGSYKGKNPSSRDVIINFTENEPEIRKDLKFSQDKTISEIASNDLKISIPIKNNGNTAFEDTITADLKLNDKLYHYQKELIVPPNSSFNWQISGFDSNFLTNSDGKIQVSANNLHKIIEVKITPFYLHPYFLLSVLYLFGLPALCYFTYNLLNKKNIKKKMIK